MAYAVDVILNVGNKAAALASNRHLVTSSHGEPNKFVLNHSSHFTEMMIKIWKKKYEPITNFKMTQLPRNDSIRSKLTETERLPFSRFNT